MAHPGERGRALKVRLSAPLLDSHVLEELTTPVAIPGWAIDGIILGLAMVVIALS